MSGLGRFYLCTQISVGTFECWVGDDRPPPPPGCDPRCGQWQPPSDYGAFFDWAEAMSAGHDQRQCPGCGLWTIWTPVEDQLSERAGAS